MKKILILLAAICCCGCGSTGVTKEEPTQSKQVKYYIKDLKAYVYHIEIEGHMYIIYNGAHKGGIIHAEHCPCKTIKIK